MCSLTCPGNIKLNDKLITQERLSTSARTTTLDHVWRQTHVWCVIGAFWLFLYFPARPFVIVLGEISLGPSPVVGASLVVLLRSASTPHGGPCQRDRGWTALLAHLMCKGHLAATLFGRRCMLLSRINSLLDGMFRLRYHTKVFFKV